MRLLRNVVATTVACCWCFTLLARAQVVPATVAKALDGSTATFPRNDGKPLLLIVGFSHNSSKNFDQWNNRLKPIYLADPAVAYYELMSFEDVPPSIMHMVLRRMRRKVPPDERSHFIPFYSGEKDWRHLVGYSVPKDAYVLVTDPAGRVLWQAHGQITDAKLTELKDLMGKLRARATGQ
jgi:hypothetical protein